MKIKNTEQFRLPKESKPVEYKQVSGASIDLKEARREIHRAMKEFRPKFPKEGSKK